MKPYDTLPDDWMDARVEAYLDGLLPSDERVRFEEGLADDAWDAELFLARQIRDGLRALPGPVCPPRVADRVLAQVRRDARTSWMDALQAWLHRQFAALWRPALAMAVLLIMVISAALIGRPEERVHYADADVQQALAEVQWALGYLSEVSRQTGKVVRDDVIAGRVVSPVQHALGARQPKPDGNQR